MPSPRGFVQIPSFHPSMAADHNSGRPLFHHPSAASDHPSADASDHLYPRKVKFLCSFGGQIIPRPSDGALRYAGGQTRIVAVRRDAALPEIMHKMSEVFGGPAALRYQLPDVDLDALVSVSSPEDLENMMEEYDKLAEAAPDGSAKLRIFLCSPSDLASPSDPIGLDDTGQRYVDAVNRILSDGSSLRRKDSLTSATSTQNSDGTDVFIDAFNEGTSPAIISPSAAYHDPSRLYFAGAPVGFPDAPTLPTNPPAAASNAPAQVLINPSRMEFPSSVPYSPHAYADPTQAQYINPQPLISTASLPINAVAAPPRPYVPPTHHVPSTPMVSQIASTKSAPESYLEDNVYIERPALLHGDPNYTTANQSQPQLLPLFSTYLQPQNVEGYGLHPVVPQPVQGQTLRFEDCYMCHKALPHAHSDTLVQEHGNGSGNAAPEASAVFHSLRSEEAMRRGAPQRVITGPLTESSVEPKAENMVAPGQFAAACGFAQIPEIRHDSEKLVALNTEGSDLSKVMRLPGAMGLPNDTQASNGMFVNIPQSHREDSLQQHQQQHLPQSLGKPQPLVKQDLISNLYGNVVYPVKNVSTQATEPLSRVLVPESPYSYARIVDERTEAVRVSPFESSVYNEKWNPTVTPNFAIPPNDLKPENPPLTENNHTVRRPQVGGNTRFVANAFTSSGNMLEGTYITPVDQLLSSSSGFTQLHKLQPPVSNQITTPGSFLLNQETGPESMIPSERLHSTLAFSHIIDPPHNNNVNKIPNGDRKDETSWYPKEAISDLAAPPSKFPFPNSSSTTRHAEVFQEAAPSDSLFCNQDPRQILGNTNLLPPKPTRVASKESMISKDSSSENVSVSNKGPDEPLLLNESIFYHPSNSLNNDSFPEHPLPATRAEGSGEEKINQELQAVAEGAAASVLQSSVPPIPIFVTRETKGPTPQSNKERGFIEDSTSSQNAVSLSDHRTEDNKPKQVDKMNAGFPIGDDIGHLQIIKNNDLEELRELGSGTFGTVYHGKWRGSDVAIKRINDRCFAGKPSEQERTRLDFWNEASKLADLHHPNVVAFYGVVVDGPGGSVATVTEYMVNGSLRQVLQKNDKSLDRSKRLLIAMDVAFGMEYLHGKNIVHFDLKSDNLLVNLRDPHRPICKVGDLGLSKVKCNTLISGGVRGTLPWMAPELLNGSSSLVSEKVDVFSYGIVLWELLTGEEPYADLHYGAIIGGIVNNTLRPPVPESCDVEWRSLMEKCWSSEPSERPSFTEIASRLRAMSASISSKGRQQEQ